VTEYAPAFGVIVVAATPEPLSATEASTVRPLRNSTLPVGVPPVTCALSPRMPPKVAGTGLRIWMVVVGVPR
jgi:hypothetical protein